jgi:hypothetical protein
MNPSKKIFYRNQAETIVKKLSARGMEGFYCEDTESARKKLAEILGAKKVSVGYGGSMTLDENGFKEIVKNAGHDLIIRENFRTPQEQKEMKSRLVNCDFFLTSTNAITLDGELVNVDGRGNRVSFLIYGPENVVVIAGMNKVVADTDEGISRARNFASPPKSVRLNCETPCAKTGRCGNCLEKSICCQVVITRKSMIPGRIKVILVGEDLGY